jgi:EAL domain-containing protein (putative c-di-GMP-specific phosphodiesterase class I)
MLPMDLVKIDGTFVQRLATSSSDQVIVRSLIELAHGLACKVIAMSVSDEESRHLLLAYGVDFVQGYHIGQPHPLKLAR